MNAATPVAPRCGDEAAAELSSELAKARQVINLLLLHAANLSKEDHDAMEIDFEECGLAPLLQARRLSLAGALSAYSRIPQEN